MSTALRVSRERSRRRRGDARPSKTTFILTLVFALISMTTMGIGAAYAAPVYEITTEWEEGTPGLVASGDAVVGVWRINVNDDAEAPGNEPVDNVTFTATVANGLFSALPDACLATDVEPVSNISDDGTILTCNVGTQDQGTALVIQTPFEVDGLSGAEISATGSIGDQSADLAPIAIENTFGMDIRWGVATQRFATGGDFENGEGYVDLDLEWTLSKQRGSEAGPQEVVYDLTIASDQATGVNVGSAACAPFASGVADGHPWSAGEHGAEQMTSFVDSCTLTKVGADLVSCH